MVVQMIPLDMPEEAIAGLPEMQEVVRPLFTDIALHDARQKGRERV